MNKGILILIIILLSSLALASPSFYFQKGSLIDLKIPCTNNGSSCSSSSVCNITLTYPNNSIMVNAQPMTYNFGYDNYTLPNSNITGEHQAIMYCSDGGVFGYSSFSFIINNLGNANNPSFIEIILCFFTIIGCIALMIWAFVLDGKNKFNFGEDDEPILEIEYGKYTKMGLFFLSYIFFWITTFLLYKIVYNYTAEEGIVSFFSWLFNISSILIAPIFIIVSIIAIISKIADDRLFRKTKQGYFQQ